MLYYYMQSETEGMRSESAAAVTTVSGVIHKPGRSSELLVINVFGQ